MRYFIGLGATVISFFIIWKSDWIVNNFGRIDWAEQHLGSEGGSRLMWKLIGIVIIIIAWMYMLDLGGGILRAIFLPGQTNQ